MIKHAIRYIIGAAMIFGSYAPSPAEAQRGPDVVTAELRRLRQFGREGPGGSGTVGLAMEMTACNLGDQPVEWFELPDTNHPMLSQNLFRLKTVGGSQRFEQIGQAWLKHGFGAAQQDGCGIACQAFPDFTQLGVGCGDTYSAGQQATACELGPRSMLHPYTGVMPGGDSLEPGCSGSSKNYPSNNHIGHTHDGISHRLQVPDVDLMPTLNPDARYFAEAQYVAPHEFVAGNGNQHNNASYREYGVTGPTPVDVFSFIEMGAMVIAEPAVNAWPGARQSLINPAPGVDGRARLVYETTDLGGGLWHYEYAIYNMNLDDSVGSLSVPVPSDVTISNIGFHAPLNHAPELNADNYANDPWGAVVTEDAINWSTDPFEEKPFANAVRWGTLYNFRFDANAPPQFVDATVGLFKTAASVTVSTLGPARAGALDCNGNSIDDRCDLDCDAPGCAVPGCGLSSNCTPNGIPDECEPDCNSNGVADACDIAAEPSDDCNRNGVLDGCERFLDCNGNGRQDFCDLALGSSQDMGGDGQPDECATPPLPAQAPHDRRKNRFISFDPANEFSAAFRVELVTRTCSISGEECIDDNNCAVFESCEQSPPVMLGWVGEPFEPGTDQTPPGTFTSLVVKAQPPPRLWTEEVVHIGGCEIAPARTYAISTTVSGLLFSEPLIIGTIKKPVDKFWGDVVGEFDGIQWTAPNGQVNVNDIVSWIAFVTFKPAPHITAVDLANEVPNFIINATDLALILQAFQGRSYPPPPFPNQSGPENCP